MIVLNQLIKIIILITMSKPRTISQAGAVYLLGVKDLESLSKKNHLPTQKKVMLKFHLFYMKKVCDEC